MNASDIKTKTVMFAKWALVIAAVAVILIRASAGRMSGTDFADMQKQVLASADLTNMNEADNQMFRRLYGLDANEYDGVMLYYPKTNMNAEELLLIKLKDASQAEAVQAAIDSRLDTQKKSFNGYGASQTAMLENAVTKIRGNYALFVSAEDPQKVEQSFDQAY